MKLLQRIRLVHSPLWFITHAIKNKRCLLLFLLHYSGGGVQKHPAHNTNARPTHTETNFPALQNPMRRNVLKSGPELVTNEISASGICAQTRLKFATGVWSPDGRLNIAPLSLQVTCNYCILATAAASAGRGGYWLLWGLIPSDYRLPSAIWWNFICYLHGALNRRGWWGHVAAWCGQRQMDFTASAPHSRGKLDYTDRLTWKWKSGGFCVEGLVIWGLGWRRVLYLSLPLILTLFQASGKWWHDVHERCSAAFEAPALAVWDNSTVRQMTPLHGLRNGYIFESNYMLNVR